MASENTVKFILFTFGFVLGVIIFSLAIVHIHDCIKGKIVSEYEGEFEEHLIDPNSNTSSTTIPLSSGQAKWNSSPMEEYRETRGREIRTFYSIMAGLGVAVVGAAVQFAFFIVSIVKWRSRGHFFHAVIGYIAVSALYFTAFGIMAYHSKYSYDPITLRWVPKEKLFFQRRDALIGMLAVGTFFTMAISILVILIEQKIIKIGLQMAVHEIEFTKKVEPDESVLTIVDVDGEKPLMVDPGEFSSSQLQ